MGSEMCIRDRKNSWLKLRGTESRSLSRAATGAMEGYPSWHRKQEAKRSNDEAHKRFAAFLKDRESKKEAAKDQGDGELIEHRAGEPAASSQELPNSHTTGSTWPSVNERAARSWAKHLADNASNTSTRAGGLQEFTDPELNRVNREENFFTSVLHAPEFVPMGDGGYPGHQARGRGGRRHKAKALSLIHI